MEKAYQLKRLFWHNPKNFDKPNVRTYGIDKVIAAGVEFVFCNSKGQPKNIFIAVNSLGDSQMYYEQDNKTGLGNIHGNNAKIFDNIISTILNETAELTYNMDCCKHLPRCPKLNFVNFYALGREEKFYKTLTYPEIHSTKHPYYPLYIYFRQLLTEMRKVAIENL